MSKLDLIINGQIVKVIDNKLENLMEDFVLVKKEDLTKIVEAKVDIEVYTVESKDRYIVKQGRKPKKFNEAQQELIRDDLKTLSIRKVATKYNCSPTIILQIKNNKY